MVAAGFDPTIPKEGFEFLTEEQARQNMYHEFEALFTEYISDIYIAESLSQRPFDEMYVERLEALAKEYQMTAEQLKAQTPESQIRAKIAGDIAMEELAKDYTQNLLED